MGRNAKRANKLKDAKGSPTESLHPENPIIYWIANLLKQMQSESPDFSYYGTYEQDMSDADSTWKQFCHDSWQRKHRYYRKSYEFSQRARVEVIGSGSNLVVLLRDPHLNEKIGRLTGKQLRKFLMDYVLVDPEIAELCTFVIISNDHRNGPLDKWTKVNHIVDAALGMWRNIPGGDLGNPVFDHADNAFVDVIGFETDELEFTTIVLSKIIDDLYRRHGKIDSAFVTACHSAFVDKGPYVAQGIIDRDNPSIGLVAPTHREISDSIVQFYERVVKGLKLQLAVALPDMFRQEKIAGTEAGSAPYESRVESTLSQPGTHHGGDYLAELINNLIEKRAPRDESGAVIEGTRPPVVSSVSEGNHFVIHKDFTLSELPPSHPVLIDHLLGRFGDLVGKIFDYNAEVAENAQSRYSEEAVYGAKRLDKHLRTDRLGVPREPVVDNRNQADKDLEKYLIVPHYQHIYMSMLFKSFAHIIRLSSPDSYSHQNVNLLATTYADLLAKTKDLDEIRQVKINNVSTGNANLDELIELFAKLTAVLLRVPPGTITRENPRKLFFTSGLPLVAWISSLLGNRTFDFPTSNDLLYIHRKTENMEISAALRELFNVEFYLAPRSNRRAARQEAQRKVRRSHRGNR